MSEVEERGMERDVEERLTVSCTNIREENNFIISTFMAGSHRPGLSFRGVWGCGGSRWAECIVRVRPAG